MTAIKPYCPLFCILFKLTLFSPAYSQQLPDSSRHLLPDSSFYILSGHTLLQVYKREMGQNSRLYTGAQYLPNNQRSKGVAFFESDKVLTGSVYYNGNLYCNIPLLYDLVSDQVIINDYANSNTLELVKEKVKYFSIAGHYFLFIAPDKPFSSFMKTGFYERLYDGSVGLFAKHEKKLVFPNNSEDLPQYVRSDFYFLKMNNVFYEVATKRSLLDLLQDKRDQLKKYIRDNGLNFNRRFEQALIRTTQYYAQLKN